MGDFPEAVARALEGVAPAVHVHDETGSTNDDAKRLARDGAEHLTVVVAQRQRAGRGRRGRSWQAKPGEALLGSWVMRPDLPVERWTLLPLAVGVACVEAVRARARVDVTLKWPNDLVAGDRKLGGILVEAEPPAFAVAGVGINVATTSFPGELAATATSVALEGGIRLDRADLLAAILRSMRGELAAIDGLVDRYRTVCSTLGRAVRAERDAGPALEGVAVDVDEHGALVVDDGRARHHVSAADVVHLR